MFYVPKLPHLLILTLLSVALLGCVSEIEIHDGRISRAAIPQVQQFLGNYQIQLGNHSSRARLLLKDDLLVLQPHGDLIGDHCNSEVGKLTRVLTENVSGQVQLRRAVFQFSPGDCPDVAIGTNLEFEIDETETVRAALLQRVERVPRCDYWNPSSGNPSNAPSSKKNPPSFGCRLEYIPFFLQGRVERIP